MDTELQALAAWCDQVLDPDFETGPAPAAEKIYSFAADTLEVARRTRHSLGTAESCTGGLVSGALTAVPGSSDVVMGGVTSYACSVKERVLGVDSAILDTVGAVSEPCVIAMSLGACRVLDCDVSVAISGIAGPGGAVPGKPVGTVWFCSCATAAESDPRCTSLVRHFTGDRGEVRTKSVATALAMLVQACLNTWDS